MDSDEQVVDRLEGHGLREIGYSLLFGFVFLVVFLLGVATAKNLLKKGGSAAATIGAFMLASTNVDRAGDRAIRIPLLASSVRVGRKRGQRRSLRTQPRDGLRSSTVSPNICITFYRTRVAIVLRC